jgi:hypothetical protein
MLYLYYLNVGLPPAKNIFPHAPTKTPKITCSLGFEYKSQGTQTTTSKTTTPLFDLCALDRPLGTTHLVVYSLVINISDFTSVKQKERKKLYLV